MCRCLLVLSSMVWHHGLQVHLHPYSHEVPSFLLDPHAFKGLQLHQPRAHHLSALQVSTSIHKPSANRVTQHLLHPHALSEPSFHNCPDMMNSMSNKSILSCQCALQDYSAQLPSTMHHLASTRLVTVLLLCLGSIMMGVQLRYVSYSMDLDLPVD